MQTSPERRAASNRRIIRGLFPARNFAAPFANSGAGIQDYRRTVPPGESIRRIACRTPAA